MELTSVCTKPPTYQGGLLVTATLNISGDCYFKHLNWDHPEVYGIQNVMPANQIATSRGGVRMQAGVLPAKMCDSPPTSPDPRHAHRHAHQATARASHSAATPPVWSRTLQAASPHGSGIPPRHSGSGLSKIPTPPGRNSLAGNSRLPHLDLGRLDLDSHTPSDRQSLVSPLQ
jgi:hypothetical protein